MNEKHEFKSYVNEFNSRHISHGIEKATEFAQSIGIYDNEGFLLRTPVDIDDVVKACERLYDYSFVVLPLDSFRAGGKVAAKAAACPDRKTIVLSMPVYEDTNANKRFIIMHEIGHVFMHGTAQFEFEFSFPDNEAVLAALSMSLSDKREAEANGFAVGITLPKFLVQKEVRPHVRKFYSADTSIDIESLKTNFRIDAVNELEKASGCPKPICQLALEMYGAWDRPPRYWCLESDLDQKQLF